VSGCFTPTKKPCINPTLGRPLFRCGSCAVEPGSEQLPREAASFCSSGVQQPLYRREGISLRRAPFHYGVVQIFRYADRQQSSLADMVQRAIQTIVFDEEVGVADLDRKVVHDLADLLEDRVHRMCPLVAVLDAQNAGALVSQCGERLSVPVDAADLLDELEAGAIPNDEDAAKIKRHNRCPRWGAWHRTPPPS